MKSIIVARILSINKIYEILTNYSNKDRVIPPTYFNQNLYKMLKIVAD